MSFTFTEYGTILDAFKNFGYYTTSFDSFNPEEEYQLLIRHDVDFYPENCLKFVSLEQKFGFKSTFFFLLTSPFYNVFSNHMQELLKMLHEEKFHLGFHFDPTAEISFHQALIRKVLDGEFEVFSNHRPNTYGNDSYEGMHLLNAYDKKYAWDSKYLSDSNKEWKHGHPVDWLEEWGDTGKNVQLVIHPIWYRKSGEFDRIEENVTSWKITKLYLTQIRSRRDER
jgi:hypothetical protein